MGSYHRSHAADTELVTAPTLSVTEANAVLNAWHQETRDLALILSRMTETDVTEQLSRKHKSQRAERLKDELISLSKHKTLSAVFNIPDAAAPLELLIDISRRCVDVGMSLRAPEDKVSIKARMNWLLRQIRSDNMGDLYLRFLWSGRTKPTQFLVSDLRDNPDITSEGKKHTSPHSFQIFYSKRLGPRFTQPVKFIKALEEVVPAFYRDIGSSLIAWQKKAPKIKPEKSSAEDVSTEEIAEDAEKYAARS